MLKNFISSMFVASILLVGCKKDDDSTKTPQTTTTNLTLDIKGLSDLGDNYRYEGWIIDSTKAKEQKPLSTGVFSVNSSGEMSKTVFSITSSTLLSSATNFVLTIEPYPDSDPLPSRTSILGGKFSNNTASLTIEDFFAFKDDFTGATGKYILATPSNGSDNDEKSGIWFLLPKDDGTKLEGLKLPIITPGWRYEGWVVIDGTPVSTGKFAHSNEADEFNGFSGSMPTPPFPGEDFLAKAPDGLTFPTDLSGVKVVISLEPNPDNDPKPFVLKPLVGDIPADAKPGTVYQMKNNILATVPSGTAKR